MFIDKKEHVAEDQKEIKRLAKKNCKDCHGLGYWGWQTVKRGKQTVRTLLTCPCIKKHENFPAFVKKIQERKAALERPKESVVDKMLERQ